MRTPTAELSAMIRQQARRAAGWCPPWMDADDLAQEAHLALLEYDAQVDDPAHRANKLRRRAFGAMLDVLRSAHRTRTVAGKPKLVPMEDADGHLVFDPAAPDDPERTLQMRQALELLERRQPGPVRRCVDMLAEGHSHDEIAAEMGVSTNRVSQLRRQAAEFVGPLMGWTDR